MTEGAEHVVLSIRTHPADRRDRLLQGNHESIQGQLGDIRRFVMLRLGDLPSLLLF